MSEHYNVLAVSSPGQPLQDVATDEGVRIAAVPMSRAITPFQDLKSLWRLYRLFKKEKPHIVHSHTPKAGLLGMIAGRLAGVPVRLHTVAGLPLMESTGLKRRILEIVESVTYSNATKVYPNSSNLAQFIIENKFCSEKKVQVLGNGSSNGIDTEFFQKSPELELKAAELRRNLNIQADEFVFVFIGRMVKDKGIVELVDAFTSLQKNFPKIRLLLVGPFEQELDPIPDSTIRTLEENEGIIQIGFQQDVRPYYLISHALVFPTYREGFPNVPMQAGCFDLPSIVTDINGCNEIVVERENGLIIPSKDKQALEEAMQLLLTEKALYFYMQRNARKMIVERYEQKYFWSLLLKEYKEHLHENVS